ncbi:hypothetical protein GNP73_00315 [Aliivibrio fischeri]|uniref:EpsG family protein n=1 Tax=Aliivibrio fischeri TaxID=668 RepID=UPI0012DA4ECE|nr:hypothetical protein [Aliivibrio fischeri]
MIIYLYVIITSIVVALFVDYLDKGSHKNFIFFIFCFFISSLIGLRYGAGHDYHNYELIYNHIDQIWLNVSMFSSPAFFFINKVTHDVSFGFGFTSFLFALLAIFFSLYRSVKSNTLALSTVFIFLCGFVFFINNQIKQGIVASVFIFSIRYIEIRDFKRFFICIFTSSIMFHPSGVLLLVTYIIPNRKIDYKLFFLVSVVLFLLVKNVDIYSYYVDTLKSLPFYGEKYYLRFERGIQYIGSGTTIIVNIIIATFISKYYESEYRRGLNIYLVGILLYIAFINSEFLERFFYYFIYMYFIFFPSIYSKKRKSMDWLVVLLVTAIILFNFVAEAEFGYGKHGASQIEWRTTL